MNRVTTAELAEHMGVSRAEITQELICSELGWRNVRRTAIRRPNLKCCGECPVRDGMYAPYAEMVSRLPLNLRSYYLDRWWCHSDTRFCCEGARKYVAKHATEQNETKTRKVKTE